jgi:hypothetical protein
MIFYVNYRLPETGTFISNKYYQSTKYLNKGCSPCICGFSGE